ncbi:MAG: hypothetical protein R2698_02450 [Microthrixaceae bacterium]
MDALGQLNVGAVRERDLRALKISERQHGLVSTAQLRRSGFGIAEIHRLGALGQWLPVAPKVLRRSGAPRTDGQRVLTPILALGGDAALSHLSAARWWGLTGCSLLPPTVTTTGRQYRRPEGVKVHLVRALPQNWRTVLHDVPIVAPELLAMQLFAVCHEQRAERLVERLWAMRLLSGASIAAFLAQMGRQGRNGIAPLRRYLDARGEGYRPPSTALESRTRQLLEAAAIGVTAQADSGDERWTGRVDFRVDGTPVLIEVQSETFHSALVDRVSDERRLAELRRNGFIVVEVTDDDVWSRPHIVVERVTMAVAAFRSGFR